MQQQCISWQPQSHEGAVFPGESLGTGLSVELDRLISTLDIGENYSSLKLS